MTTSRLPAQSRRRSAGHRARLTQPATDNGCPGATLFFAKGVASFSSAAARVSHSSVHRRAIRRRTAHRDALTPWYRCCYVLPSGTTVLRGRSPGRLVMPQAPAPDATAAPARVSANGSSGPVCGRQRMSWVKPTVATGLLQPRGCLPRRASELLRVAPAGSDVPGGVRWNARGCD